MSPTVTNKAAFSKGSLGKQVGLTVVTLGFYSFYWMYNTAQQLDQGTDADLNPILAVIPLLGHWIVADAGEAVTDQSSIVLFLLFLIFAPVSWFLIQSGINDIASGV